MATIQKGKKKRRKGVKKFGLGTYKPVSVAKLRANLGIPRRVLSRVLAVSERSLADLEQGKDANETVRRRVAEIERLRLALSNVMREQAIANWLDTPNDAFDGLKPLEVIERGESDRLWRMVFQLESGVAS